MRSGPKAIANTPDREPLTLLLLFEQLLQAFAQQAQMFNVEY
jgi:hypothetical protein